MAITIDLPLLLTIMFLFLLIIVICFAATKKAGEYRRELRKIERFLDPNEILVAGSFEKEKIERFLGKQITDYKYNEIVAKWNEKGDLKKVSEVVSEWIKDSI